MAQPPLSSSPPGLPAGAAEPLTPRGAEPESAITGPVAGRYDLEERIAKGGMGIVYRAQDRLLNRTVAIKIIRGRFLQRPDLLRRFLAEARINGRLQHPGIVPVYEVGILDDSRPFIAMKLIEGRTLSGLLRERSTPGHNLAHFLKVFEALCQTVAYAHQQGVIHRDLKPDNVMVGEFGEVQVMDWGLAKFLDPSAALAPAPDGFEAVERSTYLTGEGNTPSLADIQTMATAVVPVGPHLVTPGYTTAGEVLGTLPYMPPEQARGETERVDRRGDVFALGAILCQILTGQPPYFGEPETLKDQARNGKLFGAYILLDRCGVDHSLVMLAKRCLAAEPDNRPADAGVLAALVTQCLESLHDQTRAIEVKRLTAEARLAEAEASELLARRARRLSRMLAVFGVGLASLLVSGLGWYSKERSARAADDERRRSVVLVQIDDALNDAQGLEEQARTVGGPPLARDAAAQRALSACQRAEALIETMPNVPEGVRERFAILRARVHKTERGTSLSLSLAEWRAELFDRGGMPRPTAVREFRELLEGHGLKVLDRPVEELRAHPAASMIRAAMTDCVVMADSQEERWYLATLVGQCWESLPRDWLNALLNRDLVAMRVLTSTEPRWAMPASWLTVSAHWLTDEREFERSERLLAHGVRRYPADFTLNAIYGVALRRKPAGQPDAIRYLTVARTARPNDGVVRRELGLALADAGSTEEALEVLESAVKSDSTWVEGHYRIGGLFEKRGEPDAARHSFRTAIGIEPRHTPAHLGLGRSELARGDLEAAERTFRAVASVDPPVGEAHAGLGRIHLRRSEATKAVSEFRAAVAAEPQNMDYRLGLIEAVRLAHDLPTAIREARVAARAIPKSTRLHRTLGDLSQTNGDWTAAVTAYRAALKTDPADADILQRLGSTYEALNEPAQAAEAYETAAELRPADARLLIAVARTRQKAGDQAAAEAAFRRAINADPSDMAARRQFARFLLTRDDEAAIAELATVTKARPEDMENRIELGEALRTFGRFREAAVALRTAAALLPAGPHRDHVLNQSRLAGRQAGLSDRLPDVVRGLLKPESSSEWASFGDVARRTRHYAAAAKCFARAAVDDERYEQPAAEYAALAGFGQGSDAGSLTAEERARLRQSALKSLRPFRGPLTDPVLLRLKKLSESSHLAEQERAAWSRLWASR